MKFSKRQRLFIVVTPIAAVIAIFIHINVLGLPNQPHLESSDVALSTLVADNKQTDTPEVIGRTCLPEMDAAGAELVGEYQNPISTQLFQVWKLQITPHHTVLRVQGIYGIGGPYAPACLLAYDERYNNTIGEDLTKEDARQVALVIWRYRADRVGGIATLQENYNNGAAELEQYGETGYITVEDKWALETLGIKIPSVFQIYDPENPPQMTGSDRGDI